MGATNRNKHGQTHDQLQAACFKSAQRLYYPLLTQRLFAVPNDMHAGNVARWKQYEALGVTPGVWDMCLQWFQVLETSHCSIYPVACNHWFEFKVGRDELSEQQNRFRYRMEPLGHKFYIIEEEQHFTGALKLIIEPTLHIAKEIWKEELETTNGKSKTNKRTVNTK